MPVNHWLQPFYRVLAGAAGVYVLTFGITGFIRTGGLGFFAQEGLPWVLGLKANRAFALLSIVAGTIIVVGAIIGRNVDRWINLVGGIVFLVAGMAMMTLLQTDLNLLGFTMATCIVSFIIGMILFVAGLYGRTGTPDEAATEERFRLGEVPDPMKHSYDFRGGPKPPEQTEDFHRFG